MQDRLIPLQEPPCMMTNTVSASAIEALGQAVIHPPVQPEEIIPLAPTHSPFPAYINKDLSGVTRQVIAMETAQSHEMLVVQPVKSAAEAIAEQIESGVADGYFAPEIEGTIGRSAAPSEAGRKKIVETLYTPMVLSSELPSGNMSHPISEDDIPVPQTKPILQ